MIFSTGSSPELSLLCSLAESINSKMKIILFTENCVLENSSLCFSAEGKFLNSGFHAG